MKSKFFWLNPFRWPGIFFGFLADVVRFMRTHIAESVRLQLILTFVVCFIAAMITFSIFNPIFQKMNRVAIIDYSSGIRVIEQNARSILRSLDYEALQPRSSGETPTNERVRQWMESNGSWYGDLKILILDLDGEVLYRSANATETKVDVHGIIRNAMDVRVNNANPGEREHFSFYPIELDQQKSYLVVSGMPTPSIQYRHVQDSPVPYLLGFMTFVLLFYILTNKKTKYIEELALGLMELSKGNLNYRVVKKGGDELAYLADSINYMTGQLQAKIEEERRAEKTKNELITNVSHDLRTPLTLIMGYLRLLKDKNYDSEAQTDNYINIAYNKSEKLKSLIEDLFEYTRLSNNGIKLLRENVCINELLEQLLEELVTLAEENSLTFERNIPAGRMMVHIDPDKMIRVFENLLTNAIKYSSKPGNIRISVASKLDEVVICISNKGKPLSPEELEKLFERFYRPDSSRSSENGGAGLGLAIAKSIIETHGGSIWAESHQDEIQLWVKLKLAR